MPFGSPICPRALDLMNCSMDKKKRNDVLMIGALILIVAIVGGGLYLFSGKGASVKVTVDGELYAVYSLSENRTEDIYTEGNNLNRLVIEDGQAYIKTATCPDGICRDHRPISRNGESIVCLPNRVVVTVMAEDPSSPDLVI